MISLSIFENLDLIKILGMGLSGLSLLLMYLAYQLLKQLIENPSPNNQVIGLVKFFLGSNIMVLIIVGLFSIPIASKNTQLASKNTQLDKKVEELGEEKQKIVNKTKQLIVANEIQDKLLAADSAKSIGQITANLKQAKQLAEDYKKEIADEGTPEMKNKATSIIKQLENISPQTNNLSSSENSNSKLLLTKEAIKDVSLKLDNEIYKPAKKSFK